MRLRFQRRQQEARKFSLINAARMLQNRSRQSKSRLSVMMDNNCRKEKAQTEELEKVKIISQTADYRLLVCVRSVNS